MGHVAPHGAPSHPCGPTHPHSPPPQPSPHHPPPLPHTQLQGALYPQGWLGAMGGGGQGAPAHGLTAWSSALPKPWHTWLCRDRHAPTSPACLPPSPPCFLGLYGVLHGVWLVYMCVRVQGGHRWQVGSHGTRGVGPHLPLFLFLSACFLWAQSSALSLDLVTHLMCQGLRQSLWWQEWPATWLGERGGPLYA